MSTAWFDLCTFCSSVNASIAGSHMQSLQGFYSSAMADNPAGCRHAAGMKSEVYIWCQAFSMLTLAYGSDRGSVRQKQ